jgi:hypothetical protein
MRRCALLVPLALLLVGATLHADPSSEAIRLAALAKVWGLLKYFHPAVAQGSIGWDAALIDEVSRIESTFTREDYHQELLRFIRSAGSPPDVPPNAPLGAREADAAFGWMDDGDLFTSATIDALKTIRHGYPPTSNRYVQQTSPGVQNGCACPPDDPRDSERRRRGSRPCAGVGPMTNVPPVPWRFAELIFFVSSSCASWLGGSGRASGLRARIRIIA